MARSIHPSSGIKGLDVVLANLNREIKKIKGKNVEGLIRGAVIIMNDTEKTSPLTPLDLGNLRASRFIVSSKGTAEIAGTGVFRNKPSAKGESKTLASKLKSQHSLVTSSAIAEVKANKEPMVIMGYTANYAMAVHEKLGATFQRPGAGPKWFEASFKRNKDKVVQVVAQTSKVL